MKSALKITRWVIIAGIFGISVFLALREIDLPQAMSLIKQVNFIYAALAVAAVLAGDLIKAWRWKVILGIQGGKLSTPWLFMPLMIGQAMNWVYPARAGDFIRAYESGRMGLGGAFSFATIALEKVVDMAAFGILFILAAIFYPLPAWVSNPAISFTTVALCLVLALAIVIHFADRIVPAIDRLLRYFPAWMYEKIGPRVRAAASSLHVLKSWRATLSIAFWTVVIWLMAALTNYLLYFALYLSLPILSALVLLLILQVGIVVPSVPGRLGVFQYLCIMSLGLYGVDQVQALIYGVLLHAVVFLPTIICGLGSWLILRRVSPGIDGRPDSHKVSVMDG